MRNEITGRAVTSDEPDPAPNLHPFGFHRFGDYLKRRFGERVWKLPVDAGFTCPNLDGKVAVGGCTYCNNKSFSPAVSRRRASIREQGLAEMDIARQRYGAKKFLIYFQPFTNTYGKVEHLRELYEEALSLPDVVGLSIGTRPDCMEPEVVELLDEIGQTTHLWVEFGIQSAHDQTLIDINRAHTWEQYLDACERSRGKSYHLCAHLIFGLPGETREMMFETVRKVAATPIEGIKLHHLHVARGTAMARQWEAGEIPTFSLEEYIELVAESLTMFHPRVAVHRWVGDVEGKTLIAPNWGLSKLQILETLGRYMRERSMVQGQRWTPTNG